MAIKKEEGFANYRCNIFIIHNALLFCIWHYRTRNHTQNKHVCMNIYIYIRELFNLGELEDFSNVSPIVEDPGTDILR